MLTTRTTTTKIRRSTVTIMTITTKMAATMTEKPASAPSSSSEGNNNAHNMQNNANDDSGRNGDDDDYDEVSLEGIKPPLGAFRVVSGAHTRDGFRYVCFLSSSNLFFFLQKKNQNISSHYSLLTDSEKEISFKSDDFGGAVHATYKYISTCIYMCHNKKKLTTTIRPLYLAG